MTRPEFNKKIGKNFQHCHSEKDLSIDITNKLNRKQFRPFRNYAKNRTDLKLGTTLPERAHSNLDTAKL